MPFRVATDVGGTFTDLIALDEATGTLIAAKASTTDAPADAILQCMDKASLSCQGAASMIHGTTIAINTLLQLNGARTALLTTRGFRDVYEIGRANRLEMYEILYNKTPPLVPRELRFEVPERVMASGEVVTPLDERALRALLVRLPSHGVESLAVCLINAYVNPVHEVRIAEVAAELCPGVPVTLSHRVIREYREYERTSTACASAYVAPRVSTYIRKLDSSIRERGFVGSLLIMQSNGGMMAADAAIDTPVHLMESGPAAGAIGAARVGNALGYENVISFDMGGTTAKACLIERGQPGIINEYRVGGRKGHPILMPVMDLVEVGAGGGSIGWIDSGGALRVGPQSAGASPGPACYGQGGDAPTVTDANLLTGLLNPRNFLGGEMPLDVGAAERAAAGVARALGFTVDELAVGIIAIANAHMLHAVRAVTVERGRDPREFVMMAFGGGGPTHAMALARELRVPTVIVPTYPGNFSALGMLATDLRHDFAQTLIRSFDSVDAAEVEAVFHGLEAAGRARLAADAVPDARVSTSRFMEMRYAGQEHTVPVPVDAAPLDAAMRRDVRQRFDALYLRRYGIASPQSDTQIVHLRVTAVGTVVRPAFAPIATREGRGDARPAGDRRVLVDGVGWQMCPIYRRERLKAGDVVQGPAVIEEYASTTVLGAGDRAVASEFGHLIVSVRHTDGDHD